MKRMSSLSHTCRPGIKRDLNCPTKYLRCLNRVISEGRSPITVTVVSFIMRADQIQDSVSFSRELAITIFRLPSRGRISVPCAIPQILNLLMPEIRDRLTARRIRHVNNCDLSTRENQTARGCDSTAARTAVSRKRLDGFMVENDLFRKGRARRINYAVIHTRAILPLIRNNDS